MKEIRQGDTAGVMHQNQVLELVFLLLGTSTVVTVLNCILAWTPDVAWTAIKSLVFVLSVWGASGMLYRVTQDVGIVAVAAVIYMGLSVWVGSQWLLLPLSILAMFYILDSIRYLKSGVCWSGILIGSVVAALLLLGTAYYSDFLIMEKLQLGSLNKDTLFHASIASIASMIKTYHVSSTGLNGLVEINYHVLSHMFFAACSVLAGISVLEAYGYMPMMLFSPLLLFAWAYVALTQLSPPPDGQPTQAWLVVCILLLFATWVIPRGILWDDYFVSESFCVSLVFFLLAIPTLMLNCNLSIRQWVLLCCLIVLAGMAKSSVGVIGLGLLLLRWLFIADSVEKIRSLLPLTLTSIGLYLLLAKVASGISSGIFIDPLALVRDFSLWKEYIVEVMASSEHGTSFNAGLKAMMAIFGFFLLHFAFSWWVIFSRVLKVGWKGCIDDPLLIYMLGAVGGGVIIIALLAIPGGGASYFSMVLFSLAVPFITGQLINQDSVEWSIGGWKKTCSIGLVCIFMIYVSRGSYVQKWGLHYGQHKNALITQLLALRGENKKSHPVVYDGALTNPKTLDVECRAAPFLYVAASEHAWIHVIRKVQGCEYYFYGYPDYFVDQAQDQLVAPVFPDAAEVVKFKAP